ncbi:MAG: phosphohistidine phosphatase [Bdellovibrio sp. CG10_big_fil_rev_8_21_14_0_10_47_8]|nr:MAG: phosphohistidine phosphatase [Bdellovibrio sp. CG10_big_fil_rev_8_21_14_0_10_47_8]
MKLILFRHGVAMERAEAISQKMEDSQRPLAEKGQVRTEKMGKFLIEREEKVDLLVSSPYLRALQTAEILARIYGVKTIHRCPELVPAAPPQAFAQWLAAYAKTARSVIAVGHEPQLPVFASWILAGTTDSFVDIKKSGVLCLEVETFEKVGPRSGQMRCLLQPKFLFK